MNNFKYLPITTLLTIPTLFFITSCENVTSKGGGIPNETSINLDDTFVYNKESKYKDILKRCTSFNTSCSLNTLPLIREQGKITKDVIRSRLVVSHKWMGDRFMQMLDTLEPDMLQMLGAVTAIVIDDDIIPSFYTTNTGAIYIDPRYLWLSIEEAKDITKKDDFRSEYGNKLKFTPAWRYVKNNKPAIKYTSLSNPKARSTEDIKYALAALLYHELSHANDFANRDVIANSNRDAPIVEALESNKEQRVSTKLYNTMPLTQNTLKRLAGVLYFNKSASSQDRELEPYSIGMLFETDSATNMYNFANQYEDLAMLFESAMMKYHYNIEMDIGFTSNPSNPTDCNDFILGWGSRNQIAKDDVKARANFVLNHILPNSANWDNFTQNNIGSTSALPTNIGWCESINSNSATKRKIYTNTPIPINNFLPIGY